MPIRIERTKPRPGTPEEPVKQERGFMLVDPRVKGRKNLVVNATYVLSLEEAANLIEQGYLIRMGAKGKRPSLIAPGSLRIIRT